MDKFTKIQKLPQPNAQQVAYQSDNINIIKHKDWDIVQQKDVVVALPYFKDEGYILLRHETVPTFELRYQNENKFKNANKFLTLIGGQIDEGETPIQAIRREMHEEAGIVLSNLYKLEVEENFFVSKGNYNHYYPFLLELNYNDYKQVQAIGDGSGVDKTATCIKISLGDIDDIIVHDLITKYMLLKLKYEYKIK